MNDIRPKLFEKAKRAYYEAWTTDSSILAAIEAVTDDIRAEALEEAADELHDYRPVTPTPGLDTVVVKWLRARADQIREESC